MRLATRLFASIGLLVAAAVVGSIVAADVLLRRHLEPEIARELEREARLVAALAPTDSTRWPEFAALVGARLGRRVTLIDPEGHVRGDTEFGRAALAQLQNHRDRPEVRAVLDSGRSVGMNERLSASTNERQLYVAIKDGPPGLAVVRVSTTLAVVDAQIHAVATGLVAWLLSRVLARPLLRIADAARDIAAGRPAEFPDVHVPELAHQVDALRAMHHELERRFDDLRREREESRTLVEALSDGVLAADERGVIASANAAARRLLGYGSSEVLPPLGELFHDRPHRTLMREVLAGAVVEGRELDLGDRTVVVSARPLKDGGTLLVLSDVTDLRRLETIRRDFVANVSHELKTPLTAIAGYAGIESGGWRPAPVAVDVESAARDAWEPFAERAAARRVAFESATTAAGTIDVDPEALRQIFTNLFDNALRFSSETGRIRVATAPRTDEIVVTVTDTGSGIPSEHLPRIFERFYRVDASRSRQDGGTGLGLAIVKHLVEAHGGRVAAESELGRGTTILLYFPAVTQS